MTRKLEFNKYNKEHTDKIIQTSRDLIIIQTLINYKLILHNYIIGEALNEKEILDQFLSVLKGLILMTTPIKVQKILQESDYESFITIEKNETIAYMIDQTDD